MTAAEAARVLNRALSGLCKMLHDNRVPGAQKSGRIWLIPRETIEQMIADDAAQGIVRGGKMGRPVTTGAGIMRKDRGGPGGRPRKPAA